MNFDHDDLPLNIAFGIGRAEAIRHWRNSVVTWGQVRGWPLDPAGDKVLAGSFTSGVLDPTPDEPHPTCDQPCPKLHRNRRAVRFKRMLTLDADSPPDATFLQRVAELGVEALVYPTWRSTPEAPRYRVLIPTDVEMKPDDYRLVVREVMERVGREAFDAGSEEPERLMYMPATQDPERFEFWHFRGPLFDVGLALLDARLREPELSDGDDDGADYDGPSYDELTPAQRSWSDRHVEDQADIWRTKFAEAVEWDEKDHDTKRRGWEELARDWAWACAKLAASPWVRLDEDEARALHDEVLPEAIADDPVCAGKWRDGLVVAKARTRPVDPPPWQGFMESDASDVPTRLDDAHMAAWMARKGLAGRWCWAGGLGWLHWDGRRWLPRREEDAREAVRREVIEVNKRALMAGATPERMKSLAGLLSTGRIGALTVLMRGVVSVEPGMFDQRPDLLNCGNGVVDLRTGELLAHDPSYLLTRITETRYVPDATHPDWDAVLEALEPEVMDWYQVRIGQGITGHIASDDVLPIGQGGGSNGKTTFLAGLFVGLGEYMVQVPEKLLRGGPNDHPTELMTLFGARLAVIDETPEVAQLNVQRLKATVGAPWMTARPTHKNNVTWRATHSLLVFTNYVPQIRETDHATWRRLALVRFTRTFPINDRFRARVSRGAGGRREAVLAWAVKGTRRWYANDRTIPPMPARVEADTAAWRAESDLVVAYLAERIVFEPSACVLATDLLADFNQWLRSNGHYPWSSNLLAARFGSHDEVTRQRVDKVQTRKPEGLVLRHGLGAVSERPWVWRGIRWESDYTE